MLPTPVHHRRLNLPACASAAQVGTLPGPSKLTPFHTSKSLPGGDTSGDHVDIMGNRDMISDVLHIAAGHDVEDVFVSDIVGMSARVPLPASIR